MCAKQKDKVLKLRAYNIVLQPAGRQSQEGYVTLFRKMFEKNTPIKVYGDRYMKFKSMNFGDDIISGTLVKFVQLSGDDWYNSKTNTYENVEVNPDQHPNPSEYQYFFLPSHHRLYVQADLAVRQVDTFFHSLISKAVEDTGDEEDATFNVISTKESIDRIINSPSISKIVIRISYSNAEPFDKWAKLMDDGNKESNTKTLTLTAVGTRNHPIDLSKSELLRAALELSRSNGNAVATVYTENGTEHISTQDSPEQTDVRYNNPGSLIGKIKRLFD